MWYATRGIMGESVPVHAASNVELEVVGVTSPQFSFTRLDGADPALGVEMASTGEVGCLGDDFEEAFLKALLSVGYRMPVETVLLSTGPVESKASFLHWAHLLVQMGMKVYATQGSGAFLTLHGVEVTVLHWPMDQKTHNVLDYRGEGMMDIVANR